MRCYAFDVDETLEGFGGPVSLQSLMDLRNEGHIVGLCGNWGAFCSSVSGWQHLISVIVNLGTPKDWAMSHFRQHVGGCDDYVLVGNRLGVTGASDDEGAAQRARWRFILERDFAAGER